MRNILITGGTGYIGSHTCVELIESGYSPIILDNLSNSKREIIDRIEKITGKKVIFEKCDINDKKNIERIIKEFNCEAVIHFAGFKAVGESQEKPLMYYKNNVSGTINLLDAMKSAGLKKIVFSSSATVYGNPKFLPLTEDHPVSPENIYGKTKLTVENILRDIFISDPDWRICILRYFNPIGAHSSGLIGDDPKGIPNNLMPFISQVAVGRRSLLKIWGNDYNTDDGTGVRDYIHVIDLAKGHIKAIENIDIMECDAINLGTGRGYSVLEMIQSFEKASAKKIKYEFKPRRAGDIEINFADPSKAKEIFNWEAKLDINEMCEDIWRWQSMNPKGV